MKYIIYILVGIAIFCFGLSTIIVLNHEEENEKAKLELLNCKEENVEKDKRIKALEKSLDNKNKERYDILYRYIEDISEVKNNRRR